MNSKIFKVTAATVVCLMCGGCGLASIKLNLPGTTNPHARAKLWERYAAEDGYEPLTTKRDFDRGPGHSDAFVDRHRTSSQVGKTKFCANFGMGTGAQTKRLMPMLKTDLLNDPSKYYFYLDDRYEYFSISAAEREQFEQANRRDVVCLWSDGDDKSIQKKMDDGIGGADTVRLHPVAKWEGYRVEDEQADPPPADSAMAPQEATDAPAQPVPSADADMNQSSAATAAAPAAAAAR